MSLRKTIEYGIYLECSWRAASTTAIHLLAGHFSAANLDTTKKEGLYKKAIN